MIDDLGSTRQCSKDLRQRKVGERDQNADAIGLKAGAVLHCTKFLQWAMALNRYAIAVFGGRFYFDVMSS